MEVSKKRKSGAASADESTLTEEKRKEMKKLRKQEKKRLAEAENVVAAAEEEDTEIAVAKDDEEEEAERKRRKKEKKEAKKSKKEKREKEQREEAPAAAPAAASSSSKKNSSNGSNGSSNATAAASSSSSNVVPTDANVQVYPEGEAHKYPQLTSFDSLYALVQRHSKSSAATTAALDIMRRYVNAKGFAKPSPIQAHCWPVLFSGKDLVGIASTGSGKTLAFLFPALLRLEMMKASAGSSSGVKKGGKPSPKVLVVAPTRELAMQSYQVCADVGITSSICVYGGMSKQGQLADMKRLQATEPNGLEIVIATPGRLLDFVQDGTVSLSSVMYLVLDEADRMLDEGFEPAIRQIIAQCPDYTKRQTAMLSATWPEEIRALADTYLNTSAESGIVRVVVGSEELAANHKVTQIVEVLENNSRVKDQRLFQLLADYHKSRTNKILIFVLYKVEAVKLQQTLESRGYNVTAIHGNKTQVDRTGALESFRNGSVPLLIATDVAARGLDIPNVEYVLNYSFPLTVEDYVHRIGRTGRGGKTGISHSFFTDFDKLLAGGLVGVLQEAGQEVPQDLYQFPMLTKKKTSKLYGDFGPKTDLAGKKAVKITFD